MISVTIRWLIYFARPEPFPYQAHHISLRSNGLSGLDWDVVWGV